MDEYDTSRSISKCNKSMWDDVAWGIVISI